MLAVGIHDEDVGETVRRRGAQAVEHGGALAAVLVPADDPQSVLRLAELAQRFAGSVRAAVDDDPNGLPMASRVGDRVEKLCAGVVAGNQNEVSFGHAFTLTCLHGYGT